MSEKPRKIIVKAMTVNRSPGDVFEFFENVKNWESGGALNSIAQEDGEWWTFQTPVGPGRLRLRPNKDLLTLDHDFVAGGVSWDVHSRVIPNAKGSSVTWTFICPENLSDEQFREQLNSNFEMEIRGWRKALENQ